jgi:hypothetical protein
MSQPQKAEVPMATNVTADQCESRQDKISRRLDDIQKTVTQTATHMIHVREVLDNKGMTPPANKIKQVGIPTGAAGLGMIIYYLLEMFMT